jgi:prolyl-tRNA editing enzyme YbaK/EbsC (Cys-tRNA(Pro) deacylase)
MEWPEPVERVAAALRAAAVEAYLEELPADVATAQAAAEAVGSELGGIVKSLVFACDDVFVLALVPGDLRADPEKVAAAAGSATARIASAGEVVEATGFEPGGVAPFPVPRIARVLLARELLGEELVWIGAGSPRHLAGLAPVDLVKVARAEVANLTR